MWKGLFLLTGVVGVCIGASLDLCPEGSNCHSANEKLEVSSFEFLDKYTQKEYRSIGSLVITNASVNKVDPKLKYLKNLVYLDLSFNNVQISSIPALHSLRTLKLKANNLKNINISYFPQNLEYLDLSDNLLNQVPREWRLLKNLKTLDLYKNPLDCDCNYVLSYDQLIKSGIIVPKTPKCHSPSIFAGKEITSVNCSLNDVMVQYDEPEGSGEADTLEVSPDAKLKSKLTLLNEEEDDDISLEKNTIIDDKEDNFFEDKPLETIPEEEEGSGDDGSGYGIIVPNSGVLGCLENCSTPSPFVPDSSGSPLPSIFDQARIIFDDINPFKNPESSTESSPKPYTESSQKTSSESHTNVTDGVLVKEPKVLKQNNNPAEMERASVAPKNSTAVYAVVGVGIFIAILFVIAFVKKRSSKRKPKNRRDDPSPLGEEMKPLSKAPITASNDKPIKNSSNIPEQIPLINGQNGKPRDDTPKLKSFTPLAHPELPNKDESDGPVQNGSPVSEETEDVEIRPKIQPELLTPHRERVKIRESEIPGSIPRTPILVHRQKNSEGEIVTTLVS